MKRILLRLGAAAVATLFAVCLAEAFVRAADPFGVSYYRDMQRWKGTAIEFVGPWPPAREGRIFQQRPGVDLELETFRFCTDALGLRSAAPGTPPRIPPREAAVSVLCLGDSTTLGWGVDHADTWEVHLERDGLAPDGRGLVVHNAGHNIYDTVQEADLLSVLGPVLRPELVIVGFNANDLDSTIDVYDRTLALAADPPVGLARHLAVARSACVEHFYGLYGLLHYRAVEREYRAPRSGPRQPLSDSPHYPENWPRTEAAFERLRAQCVELGAALVVCDNADPRVPDVREWCERAGVAYVDTAWTRDELSSDVRNSPADAHANPRGHRIVADKLLAGLRAHGLLADAGSDPEFLHEVAADAAARAEGATPRGLYRTHCASCHGETGDGNGTNLYLDRKPRDFRAGAFAFGDTPEALAKTVADGLGGSNPMPAFAGTLSQDEIRQVVEHVRSLLPPSESAGAGAHEVEVFDRPMIVRGYLPPLLTGAPVVTRGLAIGLPGGASFLIDAERMQPIALLTGRFVACTDWEERGGTPLAVLGDPVHVERPAAVPTFTLAQEGREPIALETRLTATESFWSPSALDYELRGPDGSLWGAVRESFSARETSLGLVHARKVVVTGAHELGELRHVVLRFDEEAKWPGPVVSGLGTDLPRICARERLGGQWLAVLTDPKDSARIEETPEEIAVTGYLSHRIDVHFTVFVAVVPDLEHATLQALAAELLE